MFYVYQVPLTLYRDTFLNCFLLLIRFILRRSVHVIFLLLFWTFWKYFGDTPAYLWRMSHDLSVCLWMIHVSIPINNNRLSLWESILVKVVLFSLLNYNDLSLWLSRLPSLSLSVSVSLCNFHCLSLYLSLFLCLSLSLSVCLRHSFCVISLCLWLSLCICRSVSLSVCISVFLYLSCRPVCPSLTNTIIRRIQALLLLRQETYVVNC